MSELVYRCVNGAVSAEIWHGDASDHDNAFTKTVGDPKHQIPIEPMYFDTIVARIPIKDGEEVLGIDALVQKYPLVQALAKKLNAPVPVAGEEREDGQ